MKNANHHAFHVLEVIQDAHHALVDLFSAETINALNVNHHACPAMETPIHVRHALMVII